MTESKPKIYTLNCKSWIGALTNKSFKVQQPKCTTCNRELLEEIEYSKVELEVDKYDGADMFSSKGAIVVTEKLYNAFKEHNIKGFAPLKVSVVKFKYSDIDIKSIPNLIYLAVLSPAVKNIPIAYDYTGICEGCGMHLAKYNEEKFKLIARKNSNDAIHLQAYFDSYEGADIFNFADHGEIGVTQKFIDIIKDFNCPENIIIPAEWI